MLRGMDEVALGGGGSTPVHRSGDVVLWPVRPWTPAVHALLRHLDAAGFAGAPRVLGIVDGRERLAYVPGDVTSDAWSDEGAYGLGALLRGVHDAGFDPAGHEWLPWWGRDLGGPPRVVGHCDAAPWNVVRRDGLPVALVDWDTAGPVDPLYDLAQAVWLNAALYDVEGLPDPETRAGTVRAMADGYRLDADRRARLAGAMVEVAVRSAAQETIDAGVTRDGEHPAATGTLGGGPPLTGRDLLWAVTWRTRSAAWMLRHRAMLERALG
jgi:Phosphotransferase enzyme family